MNTPLHCTDFDDSLQKSLKHLVSYPQLLPFIGNAWEKQDKRVLFIAESHYLPKTSDGKSDSKSWYDRNSGNLTNYDHGHIDTRGVVRCADYYAIIKKAYCKAYSIFYNIKSSIFTALDISNKKQTLFQSFGYYNYFQRPAEKTGLSIRNTVIDNEVAYKTLTAICESAKPTNIIFVSKKAKDSFYSEHSKFKNEIFTNISITHVPHPSSPWWNRESKSFGSNGIAISGRVKFVNIIKGLDLKLV